MAKVTDACPELNEYEFDVVEPPPSYPLPLEAGDRRLNFGLIVDLAPVLVAHGYPALVTDDVNRLMAAVSTFVYGFQCGGEL